MKMQTLILIRKYNETTDRTKCYELTRNTIMSYCNAAFIDFTIREFTMQLMILVAAILFIFLGFPLLWCLSTVPCVLGLVYVSVYGNHAMKASEQTQISPLQRWVAEVYEPYFLIAHPKTLHYAIFNEEHFRRDDYDLKNLRSKIIGIVNVRNCFGPKNSLWMYGLAVEPRYRGKCIGKYLIEKAIIYSRERNFESIESVTTDLQSDARILLQKEGFTLQHVYHRPILGSLTLGMYQLGLKMVKV